MGWQNVFAAVFQAGNTTVINGDGQFVYNGVPAFGSLLFSIHPQLLSINPQPFFDPYGNYVFPGTTVYSGNGPVTGPNSQQDAMQILPTGLVLWHNPSNQGNNYSEVGAMALSNEIVPSWTVNPGAFWLQEEPDPTSNFAGTGNDLIYADPNGRPVWFTGGNPLTALWPLDRSQTDTNQITVPGTSTIPSNMTFQYPVDPVKGLIPGTVYTLRTRFNGNCGLNNQSFYINLNGTSTLLQTISGNFVPGIINGQGMAGWVEALIMVRSATQVQVSVSGAIAIGGNQSNVTSCSITSGVINAAFSGGTIGLATAWSASNAAQAITTSDSSFTRKG